MKSKKKLYWILGSIVFILVSSVGTLWCYVNESYNHVEIDKDDLGISDDLKNQKIIKIEETPEAGIVKDETKKEKKPKEVDISGIRNIALFGLDRRTTKEDTTRSDSMMVLTINYDTKEIKLTSFMRDMNVNIEGHGMDKLNHSYSYGGPGLTIKTLNQNFGLNIQDYIAVDFLMLEEIINDIDGVKIDIDEKEMELINKYMAEIANKNHKSYKKLTEFGPVNLNGQQAVAYARIRSYGDGDYQRTQRQRIVLTSMIKKLNHAKLKDVPSLVNTGFKNTETSIPKMEAIKLAKSYLSEDFSEPQSERIPRDGSFTTGRNDKGLWIMNVDLEKEKDYLKKWIYNVK